MKLIIGGYAQGKLKYVQNKYDLQNAIVLDGTLPRYEVTQGKTIIINHFHNWVKKCMLDGGNPEEEVLKFMDAYSNSIIISDEIGNGIVPIDAVERAYRERTGRILIELADRACEVERVICGLGWKIK